MGRTLPTECEHGNVIDWGDFGPEDGVEPTCDECDRRWQQEAAALAGLVDLVLAEHVPHRTFPDSPPTSWCAACSPPTRWPCRYARLADEVRAASDRTGDET